LAVPFASHRESYVWLASVSQGDFLAAVGIKLAKTWRPLASVTTWLGFLLLNPAIFPTSALRQAILHGLVYTGFVMSWLIIYAAATQPRALAIVAMVAGAVFFPGYIHIFHIYGHSYAVILMMLAVMVRYFFAPDFEKREKTLAAVAALL